MKRNIVIYILFFCLIIGLSACSKQEENKAQDNWENEVLWAEECGQDGLACCADQEPACKYGQTCCVSPSNPNETYCAESCRFGELDEFCREAEPACDSGMICADFGRCTPCGEADLPCCVDDACTAGLVCTGGICEECGLPGNICCENGVACQAEDVFEKGRTECQVNNVCSFCGSGGQIACQNEPFCNPGNLQSGQSCYACGSANQPCCKEGDAAVCNGDLICDRGFCS